MDAGAPACRNCGADLDDRYCHRCGQDARELPQAIVPLGMRLLAGAFDLDSRPVSTFLALLGRPGQLTAAYISGRRVRYAQPIQVYLWCTALFFLVHAYAPVVRLDPGSGRITGSLSAISFGDNLPPALVERLAAERVPMAAFAARFDAAVSAYLPVLLAGIVVASAVMFEVLFRRQRALTHIVFALHWAAFYFVLEAIRQALPTPPSWEERTGMALTAVALVYLILAMGAVYAATWPAAVFKAALVIVLFAALLGLWFQSAVYLAIRLA